MDVSNGTFGATWATVDAPLVELGGLTGNLLEMPPATAFIKKIEPSQTIYSWVMNNYWFTNYKAEQDGPTTFRYAIRLHGAYDAGATQRFGIEYSQPLAAAMARGPAPVGRSLLSVEPADVIVARFSLPKAKTPLRSDCSMRRAFQCAAAVRLPSDAESIKNLRLSPWEIVTLRVPKWF